MRAKITASVAVAAVALPAAAEADHPVCQTHACEVRVDHREARAKKLRVTAPFRAWLRSTRMCESSGNYRAVSPSGTYTGAYQFDDGSWAGAGGRTRRAMFAAPLEQDYRAVRWRLMVGRGAWPVCG